jgi:hypothetical protein
MTYGQTSAKAKPPGNADLRPVWFPFRAFDAAGKSANFTTISLEMI